MTTSNTDILLYNEDPVSLSIRRVLAKYPDITLFNQKDVDEIIPDLVIFTKNDPYACLKELRVVEQRYPTANLAYVRSGVDAVSLGTAFIFGIVNVISTAVTGPELYKAVKEASVAIKPSFSMKYRTQFLNAKFDTVLSNGLTFKEAVILGAKLRGYPDHELCKMFNMSPLNISIICNSAYKILGLTGFDRRSVANILKYGGVTPQLHTKVYRIPKTRRYKSAYFIIPKFSERKKQ